MKKILFYLLVLLSLLNKVQADCDSCRMWCADMHRYDRPLSDICANCNACVQDNCRYCSWCGGRGDGKVNTSRDIQIDWSFNIAGKPVCLNVNDGTESPCYKYQFS